LLATCVLLVLSAAAPAFSSTRAAAACSVPSLPLASDPSPLLPLQQAELTASDAAVYDNLGASVALSGDTALVGDPHKTVGVESNAGAVYIYTSVTFRKCLMRSQTVSGFPV